MTVIHTKGAYVDDVCYLCGRKIDFDVKLKCPYSYHRDHVVSVKELGVARADLPLVNTTYGDVWRAAHQICNLKKSASSVEHFAKNLRLDVVSTLASHVHTLADCGVDGGLGESFNKTDELFIKNLDELQRFHRAKSIWSLFHAIENNPHMSSYITMSDDTSAVDVMTSMLERGLLNAARTHAKMDLLIPPAETIEDFLDQMYIAGGMVGTVITQAEIVSRVWDVLPTRDDYTQRFVELATVSGEFYMIRLRDGLEAGESLRDMMDRAYICVDEPEYRDYLYATLGQFILPGHVLMTDEVESMKFDVVIGNPPYNLGTNKTAYVEWFELADRIAAEHTVFICTAAWIGSKNTQSLRELVASNLVSIIDGPSNHSFFGKAARVPGGVAITYQRRNYAGAVAWTSLDKHGDVAQSWSLAHRELGTNPWPRFAMNARANEITAGQKTMADVFTRNKKLTQIPEGKSAFVVTRANRGNLPADNFYLYTPGKSVERKVTGGATQSVLVDSHGVVSADKMGSVAFSLHIGTSEECASMRSYFLTDVVRAIRCGNQFNQAGWLASAWRDIVIPPLDRIWTNAEAAALYGLTEDEAAEAYRIVRASGAGD